MNLSDFRTKIFDWVDQNKGQVLTSDKIIFANQNTPEPEPSFIKINTTVNNNHLGAYDEIQPEKVNNIPNGILEVKQRRELLVSINVFSTQEISDFDAGQLTYNLKNSLYLPDVYEFFRGYDIGLTSITPVRNLTSIENEIYIQRFNFDVVFNIFSLVLSDVGYFDKIQFADGTLITGD